MKVYKDLSGNYPDVIVTYFNFEEHAAAHSDERAALFIGYNSQFRDDFLAEAADHYENLIFFNGEQPCAYTNPDVAVGNNSSDTGNKFTDIYTICPLSAKWANNYYHGGAEKLKPILFPIDRERLIYPCDKKWDAIFYGSICGRDHAEVVDIISKFNYKFITLGYQHWRPNEPISYLRRTASTVTDINIHTFDKWRILSETKVVPIYNQLYIHDDHVRNIKQYEGWEQNEAWSHIDENRGPQLKPRVTEAALFKMLMIVKRDPWNLIEYWYEPDKDFLYFDTNEEMEEMIDEISNNWENYQHIVENAYEKAYNNYTTEPLLKRMITNARKL